MAISTETFVKESLTDLDVVETYKELMEASTSTNSAYIKAKETLNSFFEDGTFTGTEKSNIIANTISSIANNITSVAMNAAVDLAKDKRDAPYALAKLREDTILTQEQANKVATDVENANEDVKNKVYAGWRTQGELVRDYGIDAYNLIPTTDIVPFAQYSTSGLKYEAERLQKANVYNTYASSYRGNGYVSIPLNGDGSLASNAAGDSNGLTTAQIDVAVRQKEGFDDNMRQHVANSSATMMSMLLGTEASGIDYNPLLDKWKTSIDYLNGVTGVSGGAISNSSFGTFSIVSGGVLTGTTVNIPAGSTVEVFITDGTIITVAAIGIVQLDNTWVVTLTSDNMKDSNNVALVAGARNITSSVRDGRGDTKVDIDAVTVVA